MLVVAPEGWTVISNSAEIFTVDNKPTGAGTKDKELKRALSRFTISDPEDSPIIKSFGDSNFVLHEFERSKAISTYLYCVVAGSFDALEPSPGKENPNVPMKLYCRKSLTKYTENFKDDWFRVTNIGIKYYEKVFQTPYPFGKFDQVLCPDYQMGAMENVGCVTYNDDIIPRDEARTRAQIENSMFNTILHEISHMWFGNLVTMKWWDDLWLNESFADTVSFMCMDEGEGADDITLAWSIFMEEQFWGLATD
jgi:aminopeptidase N